MERQDLHLHTVYSDGENTAEDMIRAAIRAGLTTVGISDHAYTSFDESYCIKRDQVSLYRQEIAELRERYRDSIRVLCGIEQDSYADDPAIGYDYVIGSVHYVKIDDRYLPIDENVEILKRAIAEDFGGDPYALVERYFETVAQVVRKTGATVIGHFDLISKFVEHSVWFDPSHSRYRAAWQKAADSLLQTQIPFEINYGAVLRGYRTEPYPSAEIRSYLLANGGTLLPSSDSHSVAALIQSRKLMETLH